VLFMWAISILAVFFKVLQFTSLVLTSCLGPVGLPSRRTSLHLKKTPAGTPPSAIFPWLRGEGFAFLLGGLWTGPHASQHPAPGLPVHGMAPFSFWGGG